MRIAAVNKFIGKTIQGDESERQLVEKRYSPLVSKPPLANTGRLPFTDRATRRERSFDTKQGGFLSRWYSRLATNGTIVPSVRVLGCPRNAHVIEQTKTGSDFVHEIEDGQGRRALIKAITVTAHIEAEQAADQ